MFFKKIFNSSSKNNINNNATSCIESDALPVDRVVSNTLERNTSQEIQERNNTSFEANDVSSSADNSTKINNVNQVVVQFSHINGLQIGSTYNINSNNNVDDQTNCGKVKSKEKSKYPKTVSIDAMMKSEEEPDREFLNEIATHLGAEYKNFMRELGFSEGQISAKTIDHNVYGVQEIIYQLLLDWTRNAEEDATVGYLTTKLWNTGNRECVYRLKLLWKSKVSTKRSVPNAEQ